MRVAEKRWVLGRLVATFEVRVCVLRCAFERVAIQQLQDCGRHRAYTVFTGVALTACSNLQQHIWLHGMASLQFQDLLIEDLLPQDKSLHRSCRERISAWTSQNTQPLMVLFAQFASAPRGRRRTEQQSVSHASFATLVEAAGLTKKEQVVTDTVFARAERGRLTLPEFVGGLFRVGKAVCASVPSPTKIYPEAALLGGMRTLISEQLQPSAGCWAGGWASVRA